MVCMNEVNEHAYMDERFVMVAVCLPIYRAH